jgi:hypothetical protein
MKTETKMNLLIVVFCILLIGFVSLNSWISKDRKIKTKPVKTEEKSTTIPPDTLSWVIPYVTTVPH